MSTRIAYFSLLVQILEKAIQVQPLLVVQNSSPQINILVDACFKIDNEAIVQKLVTILAKVYQVCPPDSPTGGGTAKVPPLPLPSLASGISEIHLTQLCISALTSTSTPLNLATREHFKFSTFARRAFEGLVYFDGTTIKVALIP